MGRRRKLPSSVKQPEPEPEPEPIKEEEEEEEEESEEESEEEESEEESEEEESEEVEEEDGSEDEAEEEEEEDLMNRETLTKLLEPLSKEQLIDLLKSAAARNPSLLSRISASADSDPSHRKIFVHGLSWDCTTETLAAAFKPFGDLEDCKVVADHVTGRCKGYGFVLFKSRPAAEKALREPNKVIGGRSTSCQLASLGHSADSRKVFVGNVGPDVSPERLKGFFAKFGEIEEGPFGLMANGKFNGYAIFVYKTAEGCKKALEEPMKVFEGIVLKCKPAANEGVKPKVPGLIPSMPAASPLPTVSPLPPTDLALNYASAGYGAGSGLTNPIGGSLNPGISSPMNRNFMPSSYGVGGGGTNTMSLSSYGVGGGGVNTVSPSVIGAYQSQLALQGLAGYQSQSTTSPALRNQSSLGASGSGLPSFPGR